MARNSRISAVLVGVLAVAVTSANADGWFDHLKAGKHKQLKEDFHAKDVDLCPPLDLMRVAHAIDVIEEGILDDGTVVIKQPDIWGQARMTKYRLDFEKVMEDDLGSFAAVLSARVARSDQASFESATTLAAAFAASGGVDRNGILPGGGRSGGPLVVAPTPMTIDPGADPAPAEPAAEPAPPSLEGVKTAADLLDKSELIKRTDPFSAFGGQPFGSIAERLGDGKLGLEPTVYLDEKKRYLDHLNELRRVNLGDDNADTAGYALYLIRMPVSLQPGEKTQRGYGAVLNASVRPDFAPDFLYTTFRSLVVADLVDQLAPVVFGILERGIDQTYFASVEGLRNLPERIRKGNARLDMLHTRIAELQRQIDSLEEQRALALRDAGSELEKNMQPLRRIAPEFFEARAIRPDVETPPIENYSDALNLQADIYSQRQRLSLNDNEDDLQEFNRVIAPVETATINAATLNNSLKSKRTAIDSERDELARLEQQVKAEENSLKGLMNELEAETAKLGSVKFVSNRIAARPYPIAPTDIGDVFFTPNLIRIAEAARNASTTERMRATDLRSFLSAELYDAYDVIAGREHFHPLLGVIVENIHEAIATSDYTGLKRLSHDLIGGLPPGIRGTVNSLPTDPELFYSDNLTAILAYAVAVDAGLLNQRLQEEMKAFTGQNGFFPQCDPDTLFFYLPEPDPWAKQAFDDYVAKRWPVITFALDPVDDQQNIADALSLRRDLQLAVALAFTQGQIGFNQLNRFKRRIEEDAETIALNKTVSAFAHGNDSFGWRFTPRFQNPPLRENNIQTIGNLLYRGGPDPQYRTRNSALEAGQRELTVVMIMPSFLQRVRFDVAGNWFKLADPDDFLVPTARMLWQGQQIAALKNAMGQFYDPRLYREGDFERVMARIDRVEHTLPLQTEFIRVPYENTQSGFELFTPGLASLAPELIGYEGLSAIKEGQAASLLLYAKNISLNETQIVAGGQPVSDVEIISREVVRITIPSGVLTTQGRDVDGPSVEVHLATPNGISNRLLIPFEPEKKETPAKAPVTGFSWGETPFSKVVYVTYGEDGAPNPDKVAIEGQSVEDDLSIVVDGGILGGVSPTGIERMAMRLKLSQGDTETTADSRALNFTTALPFDADGEARVPFSKVREGIAGALVRGLRQSDYPSGSEVSATVETYIQVAGNSVPIKLDNTFALTIKIADPKAVAITMPEIDDAPQMDLLPPPLP